MQWRERDGVRWLEADLGGATAAFTTRLGGLSEPPFDSLNVGILTADEPDRVAENRRRLATGLGIDPGRIACALQVHGADLLHHASPSSGSLRSHEAKCEPHAGALRSPGSSWSDRGKMEPRDLARADGHVVAEPGLAALVFVADCVPVALRGPGGVAMLHCGWRGLAGGIVARGAAAVGATEAAIGPAIGPCCYEVGEEAIDAFSALGEGVVVRGEGDAGRGTGVAARPRLDLPEVARRQLAAAGVERVASAGLCTSCSTDLFFSHRRDAGRTGRQAGVAWLGEPPQPGDRGGAV